MTSIKQIMSLGLIPLLALLGAVVADNGQNGDPTPWPEWVTNDYNCVIGCLSTFNDTITTIPQKELEQAAFGCASSKCQGDASGNFYQTLYYIQLFYATGSIYEWNDSAPDGYKHATFTNGGGANAAAPVSSNSDASATSHDSKGSGSTDGGAAATPSSKGSAASGAANSSKHNGTNSSTAANSTASPKGSSAGRSISFVPISGLLSAAVVMVLGGLWVVL
ncbi:hypothetical protein L204_102832 [Cryptococcus depauperatus]|nr:hypothetical protein L204_00418 [Cryptococcus depauperatus CBS 7855]